MDYNQLQNQKSNIVSRSLINEIDIKIENNFIFVNNKTAIKIDVINSRYSSDSTISIIHNGETIAVLCTRPNDFILDRLTLSTDKTVAYLFDINFNDFLAGLLHQKNNYVVVDKMFIDRFLDLLPTSPLWGGFKCFMEDTPLYPNVEVTESIQAISNIQLEFDFHRDNIVSALYEPFVFERFLKKYHNIELYFDYIYIKKIQSLDFQLAGISQIYSEWMGQSEFKKILYILTERCSSIDSISKISRALNVVADFTREPRAIFQFIKKDNNPLDSQQLNTILDDRIDFSSSELLSSIVPTIKHRNTVSQDKYNKLIIEITCFWIYRIRCSIAHKKLGEYIMTQQDEVFMLKFAEPLIDLILIEVFKNDT